MPWIIWPAAAAVAVAAVWGIRLLSSARGACGRTVLESASSMFGELSVVRTPATQTLMLGGYHQGVAWLEPSASAVDAALSGPGPVADSAYMAGWLMAGAQQPSGSALMVGLGAGQGAISLLYNFPGLRLTVVEIDPEVVALSRRHFPLVEHFIRSGRLTVKNQEAAKFLEGAEEEWDLGLGDAFAGGRKFVGDYIPQMIARCRSVYINCMASVGGEALNGLRETFRRAGRPATGFFRMVYVERPAHDEVNWIVTNAPLDREALRSFIPYAGLDGPGPRQARAIYVRAIATNYLPESLGA